jgi:hypothetical protein
LSHPSPEKITAFLLDVQVFRLAPAIGVAQNVAVPDSQKLSLRSVSAQSKIVLQYIFREISDIKKPGAAEPLLVITGL